MFEVEFLPPTQLNFMRSLASTTRRQRVYCIHSPRHKTGSRLMKHDVFRIVVVRLRRVIGRRDPVYNSAANGIEVGYRHCELGHIPQTRLDWSFGKTVRTDADCCRLSVTQYTCTADTTRLDSTIFRLVAGANFVRASVKSIYSL
jgi:hypothetical protein